MMKIYFRIILAMLVLAPVSMYAQTVEETPESKTSKKRWRDEYTLPWWGVKTNLLYDATTTMNLGVEFRVGPKNSIDIPVNWNPFEFRGGMTKWKHILVQPEFRWWPNGTFNGNFFGIHGHYAYYNVSGLPKPPFTSFMNSHRFEGWLAGAGVSWGYRWNFDRHWGIEITLGIGYAYVEYGKYPCGRCQTIIADEVRHYFGPTKAGVSIIFGTGSKKKDPVTIPEQFPLTTPVVVPGSKPSDPAVMELIPYLPVFVASFIVPEAEAVKARTESGKAYLEFEQGRSTILPNFRNNAAELGRIHESIRLVANDPDVTITSMSLTGYASPEGSSSRNVTLSQRRAQALRVYLQNMYGFLAGDKIVSSGGGEDWKTLARLVEESSLPERDRLLDVIEDESADLDVREKRLMYMGVPYRMMWTQIYPKLRRTDYVIEYEIAPIDVERGKQILYTRPGNLSLGEMFLVANTYTPGSDEWNEVFDIAARVYPDSDIANVNAAASALQRGDTFSAERYLAKVEEHTPEYWNNMGMLAGMKGDMETAARYFEKAEREADANAAELRKHLESTTIK